VDGDAAPTWVKTRPDDVAVTAKAVTARVPAAMAIVKNCLIEKLLSVGFDTRSCI